MQKVRKWILIAGTVAGFSLAFISSLGLLHQWWKREQIKAQKEQETRQAKQERQKELAEAHQQYQIQKDWVNLTNDLANNAEVKELFHVLLNAFADRYAKSKQIDISYLPLLFGGFYQKAFLPSENGENQGEMGHCELINKEIAIIRLNQLYLLNKLGHERYFATPEQCLNINFAALTETMAHEIAHYIQYVKYGKSNCESSGDQDKQGHFLYPNLVREHTQLTSEITEMMLDSAEYKKFAERWID